MLWKEDDQGRICPLMIYDDEVAGKVQFSLVSDNPIPGEGVSITDAFKILTMPVKQQIHVKNSI